MAINIHWLYTVGKQTPHFGFLPLQNNIPQMRDSDFHQEVNSVVNFFKKIKFKWKSTDFENVKKQEKTRF